MSDFIISDDLADDNESRESTVYDAVKNELAQAVKTEPLTLAVPRRDKMSIRFDTNVNADMMARWRKASNDKSMPDGFNGIKFACLILASQCDQILYDNKIAADENGNDLNFRNENFINMLNANNVVEAVRQLYGVDGNILRAVDAILSAAGYDSEGQEQDADPTLLV